MGNKKEGEPMNYDSQNKDIVNDVSAGDAARH